MSETTDAATPKAQAGATGKYSKEIREKIASMIEADSYTIAEICKANKITAETYFKWKKDKPEFSDAIKKAELSRANTFVAEAKKSLLKKITGYDVEETSTDYSTDVQGKPVIKNKKITKKHILPDTASIIFTLCNLDSDNWKNRQVNEITGKNGEALFGTKDLKPAEAAAAIEKLEKEC